MEKLLVGADPWGMELKDIIKEHLEKKGYEIIDIGTYNSENPMDYYSISETAAKKIQNNEVKKAILFCGTGMGVAIVANKFKGIYASVIESEFTAKMCKAINNTNVITMGGMIISPYRAKLAVDNWLETTHTEGFEGELAEFLKNSLKEIAKIEEKQFKAI
jgi:ribose 5-phosphate isomerase B